MTPDNAWVYAILPFVTMAVLTFGFAVVFRQRAAARRAAASGERRPPPAPTPPRPWWANPWLWLGITAAAVFLGAFVWVGFFALVLLVVPLAVLQRPRRSPQVDPRSNGHARRDAGSFKPE